MIFDNMIWFNIIYMVKWRLLGITDIGFCEFCVLALSPLIPLRFLKALCDCCIDVIFDHTSHRFSTL